MQPLIKEIKANIALSTAISYFVKKGWFIYLPVSDRGSVDLIVSPDNVELFRVQCKYTSSLHNASLKRRKKEIYQVFMRGVERQGTNKWKSITRYDEKSFDILFVLTPKRIYLLDWKKICNNREKIPSCIILGEKVKDFIIFEPALNQPTLEAPSVRVG
ncbi:MAG: group I intron-associated PD-(D/E)XK endonuclease [Nitrososphaerales archaeon]